MSADAAAIDEALSGGAAAEKPLIHAATAANWQAMAEVAKKHGCPLAIRVEDGDLAALDELSGRVTGAGVDDIMLDAGTRTLAADLAAATQLRRLALKKGARSLGYPLVAVATAPTWQAELVRATQAVDKYAGVVIVDHAEPGMFYSLLTLRQNIYTDPQKPIQMEPKLYEIGAPGPDSPLMITTNFSLTYFSVAGEVESAGFPAWLLVADSDGQSVLTGWAAGKFDAEKIAKTVKDSGIEQRISHKKLVIPGHVAGLSGEVEEELPGWQIMVGPRDAVDIPNYIKNVWGA
jgi:acetyl-CoA decarbonylase/synthase complex subunit gamma